jgi:hypothetical protein
LPIMLSKRTLAGPTADEIPPPGADDSAVDGMLANDGQFPLGDRSADTSAIGEFQEGPSFAEITRPIIAFLRAWALRPFSVWQEELVGLGWTTWRAGLVTRLATFLWLLAYQLAIGLFVLVALFGLVAVVGL